MSFIYWLESFFLTVWLWSVTVGLYHAPLAALFFMALLKMGTRLGWIASVLIAAFAHIVSFALYTLLVVGIIVIARNHEYIPVYMPEQENPFSYWVGIYLGILYVMLQIPLFALLKRYYVFSYTRVIILSFIANMAAAAFIYYLLPR